MKPNTSYVTGKANSLPSLAQRLILRGASGYIDVLCCVGWFLTIETVVQKDRNKHACMVAGL